METVIATVVLLVIVGLAIFYVVKAKKSGKKCIGCPDSGCHGQCGSCSGSCSCGSSEKH